MDSGSEALESFVAGPLANKFPSEQAAGLSGVHGAANGESLRVLWWRISMESTPGTWLELMTAAMVVANAVRRVFGSGPGWGLGSVLGPRSVVESR